MSLQSPNLVIDNAVIDRRQIEGDPERCQRQLTVTSKLLRVSLPVEPRPQLSPALGHMNQGDLAEGRYLLIVRPFLD